MQHLESQWLRRVKVAVFWSAVAAVLVLAWTPFRPLAWNNRLGYELNHAAAFLALYVFLWWAYRLPAWKAVLPLFSIGVLLETVQVFLPSRSASLRDLVANLAGIGLGVLVTSSRSGLRAWRLRSTAAARRRDAGRWRDWLWEETNASKPGTAGAQDPRGRGSEHGGRC
jgi:VanZ family protein